MSDGTVIDSIIIDIEANSNGAATQIDSLASALEKLKSSSSLTKTINNLNKLNTAIRGISSNSTGINNIKSIATAMKSLETVGDVKNLKTAVSQLSKIPEMLEKLDSATIEKFTNRMKELATALAPLSQQIATLSSGFSQLPNRIRSVVSATNQYNRTQNNAIAGATGLSTRFTSLATRAMGFGYIFRRASEVVSNGITEMNSYIENVNLFTVSMGEYAEQAQAYAERVQDLMGIDASEFMRNQAIFMNMASGFGLAEEKAYALSEGMTELAYDISSFYNMDMETTFQRLQSGIAGEIEPVRRLGIALDQASMKQWMLENGITANVNALTQADKALIRFNMMVETMSSNGAIGDFARTLVTPANALRVLQQQVTQLVRALGSLFIPILIQVLPYVQAFVKALTSAIRVLASLVGFSMPEIDYSGLDSYSSGVGDLADEADDAASGLGSAAKKAKELKNATLGFDELNVISPPEDSSGSGGSGSGGASGGGSGLDLDPLDVWDEGILAAISSRVDELVPKMKVLLGVIGAIGAALLVWKIGSAIVSSIMAVKKALDTVRTAARLVGAGLPIAFADANTPAKKLASVIQGLSTFFSTGVFKGGIGAAIMGSGSTSMLTCIAAIASMVAGFALLAAGLVDVVKNSKEFRDGISAIGDFLKRVGKTIENFVQAILPDFELSLSGIDKAIKSFFSYLSPVEIGLGDVAIALGGLMLFGPVGLLIEAAVLAIKGIGKASEDAMPKVDLFGDEISDATREKVEPFMDSLDALGVTLNTLEWGKVKIDLQDVEEVQAQLDEIVNTIVNELDSDKNEALQNIEPLAAAMSDEKYAKLQEKVVESYDKQKQEVLDGEARITEIMQSAADGNRELTQAECDEINKIKQNMTTTGIKYLSDSETESNLILQRLKDNATQLSAEQAAAVIADAKKAKDETVQAAQDQYDGIVLEAQRMLDAGVITKAEYDDIIGAAETTRDSTIDAAETQYSEILSTAKTNMGEYGKYLDTETGKIMSNWDYFTSSIESTFKGAWDSLKNWFSQNVAPILKGDYWKAQFKDMIKQVEDLGTEIKDNLSGAWENIKTWFKNNVKKKLESDYWEQKFTGIKTGFLKVIKGMVNSGISLINKLIDGLNALAKFDIKGLKLFGKEVVKAQTITLFTIPRIPAFAKGGQIEDGLFTMNQGEIAGKFKNGKSVVANNMQIIKGISEGVKEGLTEAVGNDFRYYMEIVTTLLSQIKSTITKSVEDMKDIINDLSSDVSSTMDKLGTTLEGSISSMQTSMDSGFSSLTSEISGLQSEISGLQGSIANIQQSASDATGEVGVKTGKTDTLGVTYTVAADATAQEIRNAKVQANIDYLSQQGKNVVTSTDANGNLHYTVKKYATGGFLEDGLFTMNQGEIAGKFSNGRSVVANNEQIIEGISQGVYEAMIRANDDDSDTPISVNVYLDGKQISKSVEKYQGERGRALLGNNLGYNY